jgi:hypothetical protein
MALAAAVAAVWHAWASAWREAGPWRAACCQAEQIWPSERSMACRAAPVTCGEEVMQAAYLAR